ncbi:MAG: AsmA family protein [Verrucomicrobiia bacterium]
MKKLLKVIGLIAILLAVTVAGVLWYTNHYLQTPEFKSRMLAAARASLGAEVKITEIDASLFKGITLKGVTIVNPPGFDGNLLTADEFVLRYDLLPLLRKQVHIEQLSLTKPVITLVRNGKSGWSYEKLGAATPSTPSPAVTLAPPTPSSASSSLNIALSKLALTHGTVAMVGENNKVLVRVENINLDSAVNFAGGKLSGAGKVDIDTLNIANSLFVRHLAAPVGLTSDSVRLSPLSGKLTDGDVSGDLALKVLGGTQYQLNLQVKNADVDKLMQEAGVAKRPLNGKLQATAALAGTGGLPTIVGNGRAEIVGGELKNVPALELVGALLQVPELSDLRFDQCVLEFSLSNNVMQTPVVKLASPEVQITGKGSVSLADYSLDYNLTLALAKDLLANMPKEVRAIFTERSDGFLTLDFRVWGPYDKPKTDLTKRLVKGVADQFLKQGIKKLFK